MKHLTESRNKHKSGSMETLDANHNINKQKNTKRSRRYGAMMRRTSVLLIVSMLTWILAPGAMLLAQPVTVNPITPPAFNSNDFAPVFQAAQGAPGEAAWESMVAGARGNLAAQWDAQVDAMIQNELAGITTSDNIQDVNAYKEYVRGELELQRDAAFEQWDLAADILIHAEREVYLKDLIEKQYLETIGQADDIMEQTAGQMPDYMANSGEYSAAEQALREEQYRYEKEIQASVNRSLYEYQIALAQLEDDRQRYQQQLATTDQEFQQTLAQIEQYENQIRTAIEQAVTALEQYIQNSNQFYATTYDSENNPIVDTNTLNTAGQNLDQLIQDLRNGLNTNAPLSQLALQMTQYMEARLTDAQQTRDQWDADIYTPGFDNYAEPIFGPADPGIKLSTNGSYSNIYVDYLTGANQQKLKDHLRNGDYREVVNISNVDVCGFSPSHSPAPITVNSWSTNGCYSNEGLALYSYEITAASPTFWGIWIMWWE
ncbi:MAG: TIGR04388 family protein, partial [Leptospiraceae bacterium]|nr:TIGR04388 family protein [Leptospiraceae bacterium]